MYKEKKQSLTFQENLNDMLNEITIGWLNRFSTSINLGVSSLFCDIGAIINHEIGCHNTEEENSLAKKIADNLQPIFGDYLDAKNLSLMSKFARKCRSEKTRYAAAYIHWEYLHYFLNLEDENTWIFYVELVHTESLTPMELSKKISENFFGKEVKQSNTDEYLSQLANANVFYKNTLALYFGKKNDEIFRKLFEPHPDHHKNFNRFSKEKRVKDDIVVDIYKKILTFQSEYNHELNMKFNLMFWEIGVELIRLFKSFNIRLTSILINHYIQEVYQSCPYLFTKDDLFYCIKFVKQYGEDNLPPMELVQTISWAYIKLLLEIDGVKKQKNIANQILKNGISFQDLKEMISNNSFDFELSIEERNKAKKKSATVTTIIEKNFTTMGTMEEIKATIHQKHDLNRNIFKNMELLEFLKRV